jgi:hypothetical protein
VLFTNRRIEPSKRDLRNMLWCARYSMSMVVIGTLALPPVAGQAGQIWSGGMDPVTTADRERVGQDPPGTYAGNDFMNLFRPNAPWTRTASMIQVYTVSTQFLHRSTDEQLSTVISDLRRRHIALGMSGRSCRRVSAAKVYQDSRGSTSGGQSSIA